MHKKPVYLIKKIRTAVNKNIRHILTQQRDLIIPSVNKKVLPPNTYLRELYNQAYFCHHAGLFDASISLICVAFERITRDFYEKFIPYGKAESWDNIINELIKKFNSEFSISDKPALLEFLKNMTIVKNETRNILLHGKLKSFVNNTKLVHNAIDVKTLQNENIELTFDPRIHHFGKIKQQKAEITSHRLLILLSMSIIKLNKHINLEVIYDEARKQS